MNINLDKLRDALGALNRNNITANDARVIMELYTPPMKGDKLQPKENTYPTVLSGLHEPQQKQLITLSGATDGKQPTVEKAWFGDPEGHAEAARDGHAGIKNAIRTVAGTAIAVGGVAAWANPATRALLRSGISRAAIAVGSGKIGQTAFTNTMRTGGVTMSVLGKTPKKGFAVSPYKAREVKVPTDKLSPKHFSDYIKQNKDLLSQEGHHIGAWHNTEDNHHYLDISVVKDKLHEAMDVARKHGQKAIWDIAN